MLKRPEDDDDDDPYGGLDPALCRAADEKAKKRRGGNQEQPKPGPPPPLPIIKSSAEFVAGFVPPEYVVVGLLQRRFFYSLNAQRRTKQGTRGPHGQRTLAAQAHQTDQNDRPIQDHRPGQESAQGRSRGVRTATDVCIFSDPQRASSGPRERAASAPQAERSARAHRRAAASEG
jgi:hypothetical protein